MRSARLRLRNSGGVTDQPQAAKGTVTRTGMRTRRLLHGPAFWLAVHESARIVLGRAASGEWRTLGANRVTGSAASTLAAMLARETLALPQAEVPSRLFVHGLDASDCGPLADAGWDIFCLPEPAIVDEAFAA